MRVRGADREPDQGRADCADAADNRVSTARRDPHHKPGALLVDAHRADHAVRRDAEHRERDDGDRVFVRRVAIVAVEDLLLVAENRAPQRVGAFALPARRLRT